jgi:hypothetical protein
MSESNGAEKGNAVNEAQRATIGSTILLRVSFSPWLAPGFDPLHRLVSVNFKEDEWKLKKYPSSKCLTTRESNKTRRLDRKNIFLRVPSLYEQLSAEKVRRVGILLLPRRGEIPFLILRWKGGERQPESRKRKTFSSFYSKPFTFYCYGLAQALVLY